MPNNHLSADRPAHDIEELEITPEMIEAGVSEFYSFDPRFEDADAVVVRVFSAMLRTRAP